MKRTTDVVTAGLLIVTLSPLLLIVSLLVKLDSQGPVFFRQIRVGEGARPFSIWKFRTMHPRADDNARSVTASNDPRITRVGRWLRRLKVDELPQLFNVLAGEMTLIGPRPEVPQYVSHYTEEQRRVLKYRPGLSDPATLHYRNEEEQLGRVPDPEALYLGEILPNKLQLSYDYARRATFRSDMGVLLATALQVLRLRPPSD